MQLNKSHIGIGAVCLLAGIVLGLFLKGCRPSSPAEPIVLHDTINVHDTLRITQHTKPREVVRIDTIWLPDTTRTLQDTTRTLQELYKNYISKDADFALVPITQSEYRDTFATDSTRADVAVLFSGYNARIDSIGINYQATIQPVVREKESGWGWSITVGPYVGYGVTINNCRVLAGPEIGLGVQFGIGYQKKFKSLKRR